MLKSIISTAWCITGVVCEYQDSHHYDISAKNRMLYHDQNTDIFNDETPEYIEASIKLNEYLEEERSCKNKEIFLISCDVLRDYLYSLIKGEDKC